MVVFQDIFGSLDVMAVSSGYCIGSCNFVIQSDYEKVSYHHFSEYSNTVNRCGSK